MSKCPVCGLTLADPPRPDVSELPADTPAAEPTSETPKQKWQADVNCGLWHASQPYGPVR